MGIDLPQLAQLVQLAGRFRPAGRTLMLGRQGLHLRVAEARRADRLIAAAGLGFTIADVQRDDGFADSLLARLGFGAVEAMDFSDYEGAAHVHDLNQPVPEALHGAFDMILDGGTIEHVFDTRMALENVYHMLAPGGRFVSVNGMNGWVGHGLYQFNPELVWSYWQRMQGCRVHLCLGLPKDKPGKAVPFPDPALRGRRLRLRGALPEGRVYLYYEIEKTPSDVAAAVTLQSDYQRRWKRHEDRAGHAERTKGEAVQ